jgi:hypothetical protein
MQVAGVVMAGAEMILLANPRLKGSVDALERVRHLYRAVIRELGCELGRLDKA